MTYITTFTGFEDGHLSLLIMFPIVYKCKLTIYTFYLVECPFYLVLNIYDIPRMEGNVGELTQSFRAFDESLAN